MLPLWVLGTIFAAASAAVWLAGVQLSRTAAVLDKRFGWGSALGGLILLAVATNLPELAITVTSAATGNLEIAVGNILGGIALQTVVLVLVDAVGVPGERPLTYRAASQALIVEAVIVVAALAAVMAGSQMPSGLVIARLTPDGALIAGIWVSGLFLVRRAQTGQSWSELDRQPDAQANPKARAVRATGVAAGSGTGAAVVVFATAAAATLAAGVALEESGSAIADRTGLSGVLFGATVLALITSLPEISTGLAAAREGEYELAVSDILGGNAFLPVLFPVAVLISGNSVLPQARPADNYLTALAILLTVIYLLGLLFRPGHRYARLGIDSLAVLVLYVLGMAGLSFVSTG